MLFTSSRWHVAANRLPTGEARLCRFAGEPREPRDVERDDGSAPPTPERPAQPGNNPTIEQGQQRTRQAAQQLTHGQEENGQEENGHEEHGHEEHGEAGAGHGAHEHHSPTEKFDHDVKHTKEEIDHLLHAMDNDTAREFAKLKGKDELANWEESIRILRFGKELYDGYDVVTEDLLKWEKGNLHPKAFVETVRALYSGRENSDEIITSLYEYLFDNAWEIEEYCNIPQPEETMEKLEMWERGDISTNQKEAGKIHPIEFIEAMKTFYGGKNQEQMLERFRREHDDELHRWESLNESEKIMLQQEISNIIAPEEVKRRIEKNREIRQEISRRARLDELLGILQGQTDKWQGALKNLEGKIAKRMEELEKEGKRTGHHHAGWAGFRNIFSGLGIKLYSPLEVWEAFKMVKEAYVDAFHTHTHHEAAEIAKQVGAVARRLPYGDEVDVALKQKLESANEKEKNDYKKEYLETNHFTFKELFASPNNLMDQNHHNPNKVRAILEYAASRGFLYDLDESVDSVEKTTLSRSLNHLLHDYDDHELQNFYLTLRGQNSSGREKEMKDAYERIHDIENVPYFISEIKREMEDMNLWGVIGVAKRATERGLYGEVIPWITTTVLRQLREHPEIREHASVAFFDKLGALSLYNTANTGGAFKADRNKFYRWTRSKKDGSLVALAEMDVKIARIVGDVEHDIQAKVGQLPQDDLDRYVAQILAAQPIQIKGVAFSIFDPKYDYYTDTPRGQGESHPEKEDEDYFREISDNLLADTIVVKEILTVTGSGQFKHEARAENYLKNMLKLPGTLAGQGLGAAASNFRRITQKKLIPYIKAWLADSRSQPLAQATINQTQPAIATLIREGFIPLSIIETALREKWQGQALATMLLRQVDPNHPLIPPAAPAQ